MAVHKIKKGLSLPIAGEPEQTIDAARPPSRVAVVAADYHGMKPTMHVQVGDTVRRGQLLFDDKKTRGVRYTAIAGGKVVAVHRGARRALQSVVIELDEDERAGKGETVRFSADSGKHPAELSGDQVKDLLLESGLWTALRGRPFSRVADPAQEPNSIFVTAIDTHPLAPDPAVVLRGNEDHFQRGLQALAKLTEGNVYVCTAPDTTVPTPGDSKIRIEQFAGPHPAGTVGVHIHQLDPVDRNKVVWYAGYQDVVAIGKLFHNGELDVTRVISLAGPAVSRPRLLRTRLGASTDDLAAGETTGEDLRLISGSVLSGRAAQGEVHGFLGRYDQQLSVLEEGREREFLGWLGPGFGRFSTTRAFLSGFLPRKKLAFNTSTNGSDRAIVPIGVYEKVFPMDILPSFLLRALAVGDLEQAEALGALELDEEDLALLTFVCPSKTDYGPKLRDILTTIEKEG
ncbi:MAG: Na(+)-translocating NADH-quinone reductase subunit A [Acidobacteriota bacterium]